MWSSRWVYSPEKDCCWWLTFRQPVHYYIFGSFCFFIVCHMIFSLWCGLWHFGRYTAGLHQVTGSTGCALLFHQFSYAPIRNNHSDTNSNTQPVDPIAWWRQAVWRLKRLNPHQSDNIVRQTIKKKQNLSIKPWWTTTSFITLTFSLYLFQWREPTSAWSVRWQHKDRRPRGQSGISGSCTKGQKEERGQRWNTDWSNSQTWRNWRYSDVCWRWFESRNCWR